MDHGRGARRSEILVEARWVKAAEETIWRAFHHHRSQEEISFSKFNFSTCISKNHSFLNVV